MVTTTRTQKRYDHRLREFVRKTQDVSGAVQYGVPRSTARSWLTTPSVQVVTADPLNMDAVQLQQEVLRLRTRIQKLIALLRVLLVVLKISRFALDQTRLSHGKDKRSLLRVIDRSRSALPLRSVLRIIRDGRPASDPAAGPLEQPCHPGRWPHSIRSISRALACGGGARRRRLEMAFAAEVGVTAAGNEGGDGTLLTADLMRIDQREA